MPKPIDFTKLGDQSYVLEDQGNVIVCRNRYRGRFVDENLFAIYEQRPPRQAFQLFLEPFCSDFGARTDCDPEAFVERVLLDDLAQTVLAFGSIKKHPEKTIEFECISSEIHPLREILRLMAIGFGHDDLTDFLSHRLIIKDEAPLEVTTLADLIRKYGRSLN